MRHRAARWVVAVLTATAMIIVAAPPTGAEPPQAPPQLLDIEFDGGCVSPDRTSVDVLTYPDLWDFGHERFDWTLYAATGTTSGQVPWWAEEKHHGRVDFTLPFGHYRLTITRVATSTVVADRQFDVMRCVTARSACHAATFSNPADNPAVRVRYHGDGDGKPDGTIVTVPPGASVTAPTYAEEISWEAYGAAYRGGGDSPSAGEESTEGTDQHCGPTQTRGVVGCATGRSGVVRAWFSPPDRRRLSYQVERWWETVRRGRPGSDRRSTFRLRAGSDYILSSFTATTRLAYDRVYSFSVVRCVTAKRKGKSIRFRNPTGSTVQVTYEVAGRERALTLKRGKAAKVRVGFGKVRWHTNSLYPVSQWRVDRGRGVVRAR